MKELNFEEQEILFLAFSKMSILYILFLTEASDKYYLLKIKNSKRGVGNSSGVSVNPMGWGDGNFQTFSETLL